MEELGLEQRELALTYLLERLHVYQATSGGFGSLSAHGVAFGSSVGNNGHLSGAAGGFALPPIVTPPQYQAQAGGGIPWPMPSQGVIVKPGGFQFAEQDSGAAEDQMGPGADVLMGKLLTDVRPWGRKSRDTVVTTKSKNGRFLKKGGGISTGSVNSLVTYTEHFEAH